MLFWDMKKAGTGGGGDEVVWRLDYTSAGRLVFFRPRRGARATFEGTDMFLSFLTWPVVLSPINPNTFFRIFYFSSIMASGGVLID